MPILKATTVTPYVLAWLERTTAVSILHRFDRVCNLVNQDGEVVSIVALSIGAGPFAIVVSEEYVGHFFDAKSIRIDNGYLVVNNTRVDISEVEVWQPKPNWGLLQMCLDQWINVIPRIETMVKSKRQMYGDIETSVAQRLRQLESKLIHTIIDNDQVAFKTAVSQIAGLGGGLTPSGDDFLVGLLYGVFTTRSEDGVQVWADIVLKTAVSRTTTLSGAWLRAAARGEAIAAWHELCQKLIMTDQTWKTPVLKILDIGHSSGADALAGFTAVIQNALIEQ